MRPARPGQCQAGRAWALAQLPTHLNLAGLWGRAVHECVSMCDPTPTWSFCPPTYSPNLLPQLEDSKCPGPEPKGEESDSPQSRSS